jgi:hypothetical protein
VTRRSNPIVVAGHGTFDPLPDLYPRESGTLALSRPDGSELRLHQTERGRWEAVDWREATTQDGGRRWIGPAAGPMTAEEWRACGAAMAAYMSGGSTQVA